jgi:Family of unknown function (DUF6065)
MFANVGETRVDELPGHAEPLATFFRLVPEARLPQRADRAAAGMMPTRAFRHCDALTTASAFGWYVFPPIQFSLIWDGSNVIWTYEGADSWYPLKTAQFPGFAERFDRVAPQDIQGFSPPFLAAFIEPGIVQIWSGLIARTAPGWNLLVRPPANFVRHPGYEAYEGIIATDRWFGPLFTNIRLARTDVPISFDPEMPFLQVQPVPASLCGAALERFEIVPEMAGLRAEDWDAFRTTVVRPNEDPHRQRGQYGAAERRRRKHKVEP